MIIFLPTSEAMLDLARLLELKPNHPAVAAAFDRLVLSGESEAVCAGLVATEPGAGENYLMRAWLEQVLAPDTAPAGGLSGDLFGDLAFGSIPEKSVGATGFEPAT
jgi:hypothetical protein